MSHSTPPSRSACVPLDEDAEARELEAYFRQQDPVNVAAADWHTRWEQGLDDAAMLLWDWAHPEGAAAAAAPPAVAAEPEPEAND